MLGCCELTTKKWRYTNEEEDKWEYITCEAPNGQTKFTYNRDNGAKFQRIMLETSKVKTWECWGGGFLTTWCDWDYEEKKWRDQIVEGKFSKAIRKIVEQGCKRSIVVFTPKS